MTKSKTVSLEDLNLSKQCENAYEFQYVDPAGNKTGIYISVVGSNAEKVRQFSINEANKVRRDAALKSKRKDNEFVPIEEDIEYFVRDAANRIVAWRGIDQECNAENAQYLCRINSEIRKQAVEASNELSNFTKSK
jgi:uncharacterized protein YneR